MFIILGEDERITHNIVIHWIKEFGLKNLNNVTNFYYGVTFLLLL